MGYCSSNAFRGCLLQIVVKSSAILTEVFLASPVPFKQMPGVVPWLEYGNFISSPSEFIIH